MMPRVAVAMSGGVDSSVAAWLLARQGYDLVGVSMRLYDARETTASSGCCSPEDFRDARAVAASLGIPYYVLNFSREFETRVIDRFVADYRAGLTPSPCVLCNTHLKFRHLLERMRAAGCDYVATGHYAARRGEGPFRLAKAADAAKDQSYFLYGITQDELAHTLFPLAGLTKDEVRGIARQAGLPTAEKAESQEICFVGDGDYAALVEARGGKLPAGDIRDREGRVLGRHEGIHRFTVGQRRGLGVAAAQPLYVTALDAASNSVVVGASEDLLCRAFSAERVSWVGAAPRAALRAAVKVRYRHPEVACELVPGEGGALRVNLATPVRAVAPGQAAVFYDGDEVLGGGWIRLD